MRRVLTSMAMVAAVACYASNAMAAAHSAAEVHVFFGAGQVNPSTNPDGSVLPGGTELTSNPAVDANTNQVVLFPIWMRVIAGDGGAVNNLSSIAFRVWAEGATASFAPAGQGSQAVFSATSQFLAATDGNMTTSHPSFSTLKLLRGDYYSIKASSAPALGVGTYFLGWTKVMVKPSAALNDTISLFLSVGDSSTTRNITGNQSGSLSTIAFGASSTDGVGGLNTYRRGNTNQDVLGNNQVSTEADASIKVVPEPTTLGLLALGLLAARRRRLA